MSRGDLCEIYVKSGILKAKIVDCHEFSCENSRNDARHGITNLEFRHCEAFCKKAEAI
ncbi:MAG: hypothetical protein SOW25_01465 [Helicobacter sp.]|nr:hypothetical protein [Helicobacter sp.]